MSNNAIYNEIVRAHVGNFFSKNIGEYCEIYPQIMPKDAAYITVLSRIPWTNISIANFEASTTTTYHDLLQPNIARFAFNIHIIRGIHYMLGQRMSTEQKKQRRKDTAVMIELIKKHIKNLKQFLRDYPQPDRMEAFNYYMIDYLKFPMENIKYSSKERAIQCIMSMPNPA